MSKQRVWIVCAHKDGCEVEVFERIIVRGSNRVHFKHGFWEAVLKVDCQKRVDTRGMVCWATSDMQKAQKLEQELLRECYGKYPVRAWLACVYFQGQTIDNIYAMDDGEILPVFDETGKLDHCFFKEGKVLVVDYDAPTELLFEVLVDSESESRRWYGRYRAFSTRELAEDWVEQKN